MRREPGRTYTAQEWAERERRGAAQRGTATAVLFLAAPFVYAAFDDGRTDSAGLLAGLATMAAGVAVSWPFFSGKRG
jgi:hypothetical protein